MFSARAAHYPNPLPVIRCDDHIIEWVSSFKYLGYWITTKLGWGNVISKACIKVRQRTAILKTDQNLWNFFYTTTKSSVFRFSTTVLHIAFRNLPVIYRNSTYSFESFILHIIKKSLSTTMLERLHLLFTLQ